MGCAPGGAVRDPQRRAHAEVDGRACERRRWVRTCRRIFRRGPHCLDDWALRVPPIRPHWTAQRMRVTFEERCGEPTCGTSLLLGTEVDERACKRRGWRDNCRHDFGYDLQVAGPP